MKKLALSLIVAVAAPAAFAQWTQNNLINFPGAGAGGGDVSALQGTETLFGWGAQTINSNTMADDFTVTGAGWTVHSITVYSYQTGATAPSITGANWAVGAAPTLTMAAATTLSAGWWAPNGNAVYRTTSTAFTDTNRRIQEVVIDMDDFFLAAGTHYLSFNLSGTGASGPWVPAIPSANAVNGQNAFQSTAGGAFVQAFVDGTTTGGDVPFVINATPVPEPATMIALGLGAAALLRRRAKK